MSQKIAKIPAEKREQVGTSSSRKLRRDGKVPVNLCGLGQESISLTVSSDVITDVVVSGIQVVDIDCDGSEQKAMIREVQWDTFLTHILHVDLQRVDPNARVDVEIPVEIRGTANEGVLENPLHTITVNCPVFKIPEKVSVKVGTLKIGDEVKVADLEMEDDVNAVLDGGDVVVRITEASDVEIVQEDMSGAAEPEVIGAKQDDEEAAE